MICEWASERACKRLNCVGRSHFAIFILLLCDCTDLLLIVPVFISLLHLKIDFNLFDLLYSCIFSLSCYLKSYKTCQKYLCENYPCDWQICDVFTMRARTLWHHFWTLRKYSKLYVEQMNLNAFFLLEWNEYWWICFSDSNRTNFIYLTDDYIFLILIFSSLWFHFSDQCIILDYFLQHFQHLMSLARNTNKCTSVFVSRRLMWHILTSWRVSNSDWLILIIFRCILSEHWYFSPFRKRYRIL